MSDSATVGGEMPRSARRYWSLVDLTCYKQASKRPADSLSNGETLQRRPFGILLLVKKN